MVEREGREGLKRAVTRREEGLWAWGNGLGVGCKQT